MTFCSNCGSKLDEKTKFCSKCGMSTMRTKDYSIKRRSIKNKNKSLSPIIIALIVIVVVAMVIGLISALVFLGDFAPFGDVTGSGSLVTKEQFFSDFNTVDAENGFNVEISKSDTYEVQVIADDNVMEFISVSKSGDTLRVGLEWGTKVNSATLKIKIIMPDLQEIELSGGSVGKIEDFITSNSLSVDLSGGSQLSGSGEAEYLIMDVSSGSQLDFSDYLVGDVNIELSGGSQAIINLDGTLNADLSGGSQLYYFGEPSMGDVDISGGSFLGEK